MQRRFIFNFMFQYFSGCIGVNLLGSLPPLLLSCCLNILSEYFEVP